MSNPRKGILAGLPLDHRLDRQLLALFTGHPIVPHLRPHVPLIRACEARGIRTKYAAPDSMADRARAYGLNHVKAGVNWSADPAIRGGVARTLLDRGNDAFNREWFGHLANAARQMVPDVLAICEQERPDVIVTDISEFGGYLAGQLLDIPVITSDNGLARLVSELHDPVIRPILNDIRRELRMGPEPKGVPGSYETVLTPAPKSLLLPDVDFDVVPFRHRNPREDAGQLPDGVFGNPDHPNGYIFWGMTGADYPEWQPIFERSYRTAIAATGNQPLDILMVCGGRNVEKYVDREAWQRAKDELEERLGRRATEAELARVAAPAEGAENVLVVGETDQPAAIEKADFVGYHGGFGTTREVHLADPEESEPTPAIVMPNQTDQPSNARMVAAHGLGTYLDPKTVTPEEFREAVQDLLSRSAEIKANHAPFITEMEALPSLPELSEEVARALELGDVEFRALKGPDGPGEAGGAPGGPRPDGPITITGPGGGAADPRDLEPEAPAERARPVGPGASADATPSEPAEQEGPARDERVWAPADLSVLGLADVHEHESPTDHDGSRGAEGGPAEGESEDLDPSTFGLPGVLEQYGHELALEQNGHKEGPAGPSADGPDEGPGGDDSGPVTPRSGPNPSPGPLSTGPGGGAAPVPERISEPTERIGEEPEQISEPPKPIGETPEPIGRTPKAAESARPIGNAPEPSKAPERIGEVPARRGTTPPSGVNAGGSPAGPRVLRRGACAGGRLPKPEDVDRLDAPRTRAEAPTGGAPAEAGGSAEQPARKTAKEKRPPAEVPSTTEVPPVRQPGGGSVDL